MNIVFRVDASLDIGSGHVMRCLTLANTLSELGANISFICREHPGNLLELIQDRGFNSAALLLSDAESCESLSEGGYALAHDSWLGTDWRSDAEQSQAAINDEKVDWLIVDHYALDARWESAMRPFCERIMVIDDLADRDHDCDLLLDQNLIADMEHRYDNRVPSHCVHLLGPSYALLQSEYAELHPRTPPRRGTVQRIFVFFGSADNHNLTGQAIAAFLDLDRSDIVLDVVINPASPNAAAIRGQAYDHTNITLHETLPSLAPLMLKADLAIGAAGTTTWERCCLGLPTVVVTVADNQRAIAEELNKRGIIEWLGSKDDLKFERLRDVVAKLLDSGISPEWLSRCWQTVDGRGVERVTRALFPSAESNLRVRLANADDASLILNWANDPQVRKNAFSSGIISRHSHAEWFCKRLKDPKNCRIYVIELENGLPIGQVRFERQDLGWEITYALDTTFRGKGLGSKLLKTAIVEMERDKANQTLFGQVKESNKASRKVFEELGFSKEILENGVLRYVNKH